MSMSRTATPSAEGSENASSMQPKSSSDSGFAHDGSDASPLAAPGLLARQHGGHAHEENRFGTVDPPRPMPGHSNQSRSSSIDDSDMREYVQDSTSSIAAALPPLSERPSLATRRVRLTLSANNQQTPYAQNLDPAEHGIGILQHAVSALENVLLAEHSTSSSSQVWEQGFHDDSHAITMNPLALDTSDHVISLEWNSQLHVLTASCEATCAFFIDPLKKLTQLLTTGDTSSVAVVATSDHQGLLVFHQPYSRQLRYYVFQPGCSDIFGSVAQRTVPVQASQLAGKTFELTSPTRACVRGYKNWVCAAFNDTVCQVVVFQVLDQAPYLQQSSTLVFRDEDVMSHVFSDMQLASHPTDPNALLVVVVLGSDASRLGLSWVAPNTVGVVELLPFDHLVLEGSLTCATSSNRVHLVFVSAVGRLLYAQMPLSLSHAPDTPVAWKELASPCPCGSSCRVIRASFVSDDHHGILLAVFTCGFAQGLIDDAGNWTPSPPSLVDLDIVKHLPAYDPTWDSCTTWAFLAESTRLAVDAEHVFLAVHGHVFSWSRHGVASVSM